MVIASIAEIPRLYGSEPLQEWGLIATDLELIKQLCLPDKIIVQNLGSSRAAISMRITRIGVKLGVENRTALLVKALMLGLVNLDQLVYRSYDGETNKT